MELQLFNYEGNEVSFRTENDKTYLNTSDMARPFNKKVARQWFDNKETHDFIHTLAKERGIEPIGQKRTSLNTSELANMYPSLLKVVKGGLEKQGTWIYEDVAIEFARWLNPKFAIWCNDRIKELIRFGFTASEQTIDNLVNNPDLLIEMATALKKSRADAEQSKKQLQLANNTIVEQAPLVQLANDCYTSKVTMTATIISTRLGFVSAKSLNSELKKLGVQYKIDGCWKLHAKYEGKGYTKTIPVPYKMKDGTNGIQNQMEWFEAGFVFLRELINKKSK